MKPFPILLHLLAAVLLLPLLCACSYMSEDYGDCDKPEDPLVATGNHYINLCIVVSAGNESATRADEKPAGGEDGDGREAGQERENEVTGITLMLYELDDTDTPTDADKGCINSSQEKTISFIKYYPVTFVSRETAGTTPSGKIEAVYTTGNQSLEGSDLDLTKTYGVIVVANLNLEKSSFTVGTTTVKDVCDYYVTTLYDGNGFGANANNFVMSLEESYAMEFRGEPDVNGKTYYNFDDIIIERLAARVDFWTKGATYTTSENNTDYTTPGYEYDVKTSDDTPSNDKFVLTAVTPFNLYDSEEYLIKRLGEISTESEATNISYLADEPKTYQNQSKYVLDPYTLSKTTPPSTQETPSYTHPLSGIVGSESTTGSMPMSAFHADGIYKDALTTYTEDGEQADNLIICYPKENTLPKDAPLYYYATGLRIEGDYYKDGKFDQHYVYYGFLRHEGEGTGSYEIYTKEELEEKKGTLTGQSPMNFGVVRNNIYRVSIDKITEKDPPDTPTPDPPTITWRIMVKNWDVFTHKTIFM